MTKPLIETKKPKKRNDNRTFNNLYQCWLRNRKYLFYPSLTGLSIIFSEPISQIIIALHLELIIDPIEINWPLSIALGAVFLISYLVYAIKISAEHRTKSPMKLLFWLSLTVSLSYYQLAIDELIFFPKKGNSSYIAIVYILAALYSLYYIVSSFNFPRQKNSKLIAEDSIVLQKGIEGSLRKGYAEQLAKELLNINSKQAFAIAITGGWGTGKSTFISFITEKVKADTAAIIVEFHPWKNKGEEAVIKDFFYTLRKQLSPYDDRLGPQINNYLNSLFNISAVATNTSLSTFSKLALKSINLLEEPQGTEEEYNKLRKIIKEIPLPILIIIDDLDRLDSPEIIAVLKLIRNVANFEGLSFITAYDKDYVHHAIKSNLNEHGSHYFLEKIVQMEVSLPVMTKEELFDILKTVLQKSQEKTLEELVPTLEKEAEDRDNHWFKSTNPILWHFISNVRDIVRFHNSLVLDYPKLSKYIDSQDIFYIYLIKLKFPRVYKALWQSQGEIFDDSGDKLTFITLPSPEEDTNEKNEEDKHLIKELLKNMGQEKFIVPLIETLNVLFPQAVTKENQMPLFPNKYSFNRNRDSRIYHKDLFNIMYSQFVPESYIDYEFFDKIRHYSFKEIDELLADERHDHNDIIMELNRRLDPRIIDSIQTPPELKNYLYFCINIKTKNFYTINNYLQLIIENKALQERVTEKNMRFTHILKEVVEGEEFIDSTLIFYNSLYQKYDNEELGQILAEALVSSLTFYSKKENSMTIDEFYNAAIMWLRLRDSYRETTNKFYLGYKLPDVDDKMKLIFSKNIDRFIHNLIKINNNSYQRVSVQFNSNITVLFKTIRDLERFVHQYYPEHNTPQYVSLSTAFEAFKTEHSDTLTRQSFSYKNLGRHFNKDIQHAPLIFLILKSKPVAPIDKFINQVNTDSNNVQKCYISEFPHQNIIHDINIHLEKDDILIFAIPKESIPKVITELIKGQPIKTNSDQLYSEHIDITTLELEKTVKKYGYDILQYEAREDDTIIGLELHF